MLRMVSTAYGEANPNGEEQLIRVESNTTKDVQDDIDTY